MIRITVETEHLKAMVEDKTGLTVTHALEAFKGAMQGVGYVISGDIIVEDENV